MLLSETWLRSAGDEAKCEALTPPGYAMRSYPRDTLFEKRQRGGGVAFILKDSINRQATSSRPPVNCSCFEAASMSLIINNNKVNIFCIYRPPRIKRINIHVLINSSLLSSKIFFSIVFIFLAGLS